ncbi:MAG: NAD(P)H dehydrogenase, partial [Butyrivibrio sp.]
MKLLVINASPKGEKSNTFRLTKAFIMGMNAKEPVDIRCMEVSSLHINSCKGCFVCWHTTPGQCCMK